jgi:hypothetical protein
MTRHFHQSQRRTRFNELKCISRAKHVKNYRPQVLHAGNEGFQVGQINVPYDDTFSASTVDPDNVARDAQVLFASLLRFYWAQRKYVNADLIRPNTKSLHYYLGHQSQHKNDTSRNSQNAISFAIDYPIDDGTTSVRSVATLRSDSNGLY